jgi:hypothetical protein
MAVQYSISNNEEYIRLDASGFYTPGNEAAEARELWSTVAKACKEHKIDRVLALSKMTGQIPTIVRFEIASNPASLNWERSFRIAVVFADRERYESHLFDETVLVNRYYNMKAFMDEEEAKAWLLRS